ncbi:zf-C3Hc3H domain-containing protein [Cephalotus follicularis]|uniref:Zf-C3Hc3H domain-containing protein n=1 Tax=Cephalotus follicularis TaxID=3775 RepID=A0A1Q3D2Z9_CEPFO|nr:zf-C3Hc3H domain-containing protein [Cephalotus follicularis]
MANPPRLSSPPSPPQQQHLGPLPLPLALDNNGLAGAEFLTLQEVLTRRSKRVKQLAKIYKSHYWLLMEELKRKHREFYWLYGKSPFKEDDNNSNNNSNNCRTGEKVVELERCGVTGCKAKAMALTRFCHQHILSDSKQKLYKACSYVVKRLRRQLIAHLILSLAAFESSVGSPRAPYPGSHRQPCMHSWRHLGLLCIYISVWRFVMNIFI